MGHGIGGYLPMVQILDRIKVPWLFVCEGVCMGEIPC